MEEKPVIFVCGASARQVVSMAALAGIVCYAADLFCDFDTRKFARQSLRIQRLDQLLHVANQFDYDHCVLDGRNGKPSGCRLGNLQNVAVSRSNRACAMS